MMMDYYRFSRPELQSLIPPSARRVLDVGCATGALGRALKERQQCHVTGIEFVPNVAQEAALYLDEVLTGDATTAMTELPEGSFDCIVFADVLEHLVDPGACLEQALRLLHPDGALVASIPNVRHWSVVKDLLEGRWEYQDAGILDRTHLRFYTRDSILRLFRGKGFQIETLGSSQIPDYEVPSNVIEGLAAGGIDTSSLASEGRIYQYLLKAVPRPPKVSETPSALTSIVMLTLNQLEVTKLCVESLYRHTPESFELIMVDNGSTDGTVDYLRALADTHPNVKVVANNTNRGFAGGCNQGIAEASGEYILLLNNDTVVAEGWLDGLIRAVSLEGVGIAGPRTNRIVGPQLVESVAYDPVTLAGFEDFACQWRRKHQDQVWETPRIIGFCMIIRRSVIDRIGGLDTRFGRGNFEDDDFGIRVKLAGFKIAVAEEVFIHHFGSVTFKGQKIDYRELMLENWGRFKWKWLLPENLSPEQGYRYADVLALPFDPTLHTEPLYSKRVDPATLPDRRSFNIVLADQDRTRLKEALITYLQAFREEDDIALHVLAGQEVEQVHATILEAIADCRMDPEQIPELSLLDAPSQPLKLSAYLRAADLVIGSPPIALGARDMDIPAFVAPSVEALQLAFTRFPGVRWSQRPVDIEIRAKDRWLLSYETGWETGLESFLQIAGAAQEVALLLRVPPGNATEAYEKLSEWLVLHGFDPERIPDVVVIDTPLDSEVAMYRLATIWLDNGNALNRAIALAMGLQIVRPQAILAPETQVASEAR